MGGFVALLIQIAFWWFLIRIIRTAANKGKKAANEQKKADPAGPAQPASRPVAPSRPAAAKERPAPAAAKEWQTPVPAKERQAVSPRLQQDDYARKAAPASPRPKVTVRTEGNSTPHVVAPSFGKKHAHTESSMTGFEECPPEQTHVELTEEAAPQESAELSFAGQEIIKAMLYSEILSKPKALR